MSFNILRDLPPSVRNDLLQVITDLVKTAETMIGGGMGATKRELVVAWARIAIPKLNGNAVPNWLEDAAIGALVDLVVGVLNSTASMKGWRKGRVVGAINLPAVA